MEHPRTFTPLRLPRIVEADPRCAELQALLARNQRPIWEQGANSFSHVPYSPELERALGAAMRARHLVIGLEKIEKTLEIEKKGLEALRQKQGTAPAQRVSRLLLVANDGAERFYRACETLVLKHDDRLLLVVIDAPSERLAEHLFGPGREIKALLVSDKDSVSRVLLSIQPTHNNDAIQK